MTETTLRAPWEVHPDTAPDYSTLLTDIAAHLRHEPYIGHHFAGDRWRWMWGNSVYADLRGIEIWHVGSMTGEWETTVWGTEDHFKHASQKPLSVAALRILCRLTGLLPPDSYPVVVLGTTERVPALVLDDFH